MKNENQEYTNGVDPKINAIKEIIFGSEIQDYNQQFKELAASMEKQKLEFEQQIESMKKELKSTIDSFQNEIKSAESKINTLVNKEVEALKDKKADRKQLAKMFAQLAEKLSS